MGDISNTQYFRAVQEEKKMEVSQVLREVYEALTEKGYNPINQIVGTSSRRTPPISPTTTRPRPDPQAGPGRAAAGAGPQIFGAVTVFLLHSPAERASVRMARRPSLRDFLRPGAEGRSLPRNWL